MNPTIITIGMRIGEFTLTNIIPQDPCPFELDNQVYVTFPYFEQLLQRHGFNPPYQIMIQPTQQEEKENG